MAIVGELQFEKLDSFYLDPLNPRLGRNNTGPSVKQDKILELMRDWELEELAVSFCESGFWPQEALLVVRETIYGKKQQLVVVEGNRRIAALILLKRAIDGTPISKKWSELIKAVSVPDDLFRRIPFFELDSRKSVDAFLGFRHVTGIKEWRPAEKAEYISKLIDDRKMSYQEVMRKIGSNTQTVRQNYICYRLLLQIEKSVEDLPAENIEDRFSVMYLSLRTEGVRDYLGIDIMAEPERAQNPVPTKKAKALRNFSVWLFGDAEREPLFTDSRYVDSFGRILQSREAVEYLERTQVPSFDIAHRLAGGDEPELVRLIANAADNVQLTLTRAHHFKKSKPLREQAVRLKIDVGQLLSALGLDNE